MDSPKPAQLKKIKQLKDEIEQLKYTINMYNILSENEDVGIIKGKFNDRLQIEFINKEALEMFGFTKEQFESEVMGDYALLDDFKIVQGNIRKLVKTESLIHFKTKIKRRDGINIWITGSGDVVKSKDGKKSCIFTFRNLAGLQSKGKELIDLQSVERNIKSGILVCKADEVYTIIYANEKFADILGYTYEEMQSLFGTGYVYITAEEDWEYVTEEVTAQIESTNGFFITYRVTKKNGDKIWIEDRGAVLVKEGQDDVIQCIVTDITAQKEKEEALLISEKRYEIIMNYSGVTTFDYDIQTKRMTLHSSGVEEFNFPTIIDDAVETAVNSGMIFPESIDNYRELYRRVEAEDLVSEAVIYGYSADGESRVYELSITNIFNDRGNQLVAVGIKRDITEKREKEIAMLEEQKFYKNMMAKATIVYTVNVAEDKLISGHETWCKTFNVELNNNYSQLMEQTSKKVIYSADQTEVKNTFLRENILTAYKNGKDQLNCTFRLQNKFDDYVWTRSTMNLLEDPLTGDIIGYSYTENIDEEKKKELKLIYKAEHDTLTDMYNKDSTEKYITNFLATSSGYLLNHAFLIIDIDYFKAINDNFGHAFGDAILSQVAGKICRLFREEDVLGRIGGDEFVVFIKNIQNENIVIKKAKEICSAIIDVFVQNGTNYKISASIGIAFYNKHGSTYKDLYTHSDSALYISKENGRNQYTVYNSNIQNTKSAVKAIDSGNLVESIAFASNISEYAFRILYEAQDKKNAVNSVLELVGKHYNVSRVYIFEDSKDGKYTSNTFEWCNENTTSQITYLQNISYDVMEGHMDNFNSEGIFHMSEINKVPLIIQKALEPQNVKSMLQYRIVHDSKNKGFIGFDEYEHTRIYEKSEIAEFQRISHILGLFISETRILEENIATKNMAISIVNGLDSYAYVCTPKTYELLFINDKARVLVPNALVGDKCYRAFRDRKKPCEECPMKCLENGDTNTLEIYNDFLDVWVKSVATYINWLDGEQVCLVNNVDITDYKK